MIRVQCEMGGKNPVIVLADADLDLAVEATAQGAFGSTGQRCTATSRVIVEEAIADAFVEALAARAAQGARGQRRWSAASTWGPAVDQSQLETDLRVHRDRPARRARARSAAARRSRTATCAHGYFVEPTVFDHVTAVACASPRRRSSAPWSRSSA